MNFSTKKTFYSILILFIIYSVIFLIFTYPLLFNFGNSLLTSNRHNADTPQFLWNTYHFAYKLEIFENPFYTNLQFYPNGVALWMNANVPIFGMLAFLIKNNFLAMNIIVFLNFISGSIGSYFLAKKFNAPHYIALFIGFVYSFAPHKMARIEEHYNLILNGAIPFVILLTTSMLYVKEDRLITKFQLKKILILLSLFFILIISDYFCFYSSVVWIILYCTSIFAYLYFKKCSKLKIVVILFTVLLTGHLITRCLQLLSIDDKGGLWWSNDLLLLFIPSYKSLLYTADVSNIATHLGHMHAYGMDDVMFLGFGLTILFVTSLILFIKSPKNSSVTIFLFVTILLMSLCFPVIKINGKSLFYSPTSWNHFLLFVNNFRVPGRFISLLLLTGTTALLPLLSQHLTVKYRYFILLIMFITIVEYVPIKNHLISTSDIPLIYSKIPFDNKTILNIPLGIIDGNEAIGEFDSKELLYQTQHKHPIIGGYTSRVPVEIKDAFKDDPICMSLCGDSTYNQLKNIKSDQIKIFLKKYNIGYIVVSKKIESNYPTISNIFAPFVSKKNETDLHILYQISNK